MQNTQVMSTRPTQLPPVLGFVQNTRTILTRGAPRGSFTNLVRLEAIRDYLKKIVALQDAKDVHLRSDQIAFSFEGGVARLIPLVSGKKGNRIAKEPLLFDRHGWNQFARSILPAQGGGFVQKTVQLGVPRLKGNGQLLSDEEKIAFQQAHQQLGAHTMMVHARAAKKALMFRTVVKPLMDKNGAIVGTGRFIRATVSQKYAPYSHLDLLEALLKELGNQLVYKWTLADSGVFLRMIAEDAIDGELSMTQPYATTNAWNSETGQKRTGTGGGTVHIKCKNGICAHTSTGNFEWTHLGSTDRIRTGMEDALAGIRTAQSGLLDSYSQALNISINDGFAFMEQMMNGFTGTTKSTIEGVRNGMKDATSAPSNTLAGVVDGMTLLAQDNSLDLWEQIELEKQASKVMERGIGMARDSRIKVKVPVLV